MSTINSRAKGKRCACGCGTEIPTLTSRGEPQRFAHGHNPRIPLEEMYEVQDRGWITTCWIWKGGQSGNGYGRCRNDGRMQPAHRASYERAGNFIPEGAQLDHLCRQRLCVNPDHLEAVTPTENVRRSTATKLTEAAVDEIRKARATALAAAPPKIDGTPRCRVPNGRAIRAGLAERYGVTPDQIKHIWGGRSWA